MIIPFTVRLSKGSYATTIPKPMGLHLKLDEVLNKNQRTTLLIAEDIEAGVLIRHLTPDEKKRFEIS